MLQLTGAYDNLLRMWMDA
ncbi:TPA: hypothetical protein ACYLN4_007501 [Burkholderia lata]